MVKKRVHDEGSLHGILLYSLRRFKVDRFLSGHLVEDDTGDRGLATPVGQTISQIPDLHVPSHLRWPMSSKRGLPRRGLLSIVAAVVLSKYDEPGYELFLPLCTSCCYCSIMLSNYSFCDLARSRRRPTCICQAVVVEF